MKASSGHGNSTKIRWRRPGKRSQGEWERGGSAHMHTYIRNEIFLARQTYKSMLQFLQTHSDAH